MLRHAWLAAVAIAAPAWAQGGFGRPRVEPNVAYDGRFTFARIRYLEYRSFGWAYDYPEMERNLMTVMREISVLRPHPAGTNIFTLDDPELLRYPVAYVSEPGYWIPTDAEVEGLRRYLAKGGFIIFDDFMGRDWANFERQFRRVLPSARIEPMQVGHPIFDSFFHISSLDMTYPNRPSIKAEFYGVHEDNDPKKRLIAIINYNNDIGDYMEWSGSGWLPVNLTNDAYKLAVNYLVYGLTH